MTKSDRLDAALACADAANAADPNRVQWRGRSVPRELFYAERVSEWIEQLVDEPSEPLRLAARCHHLRRWAIPRDSYPRTRKGYLTWRSALRRFHARQAAELLRGLGYEETVVERVASIVSRRSLSTDPEVQALEDAACLVFLEHRFSEFARSADRTRVESIVRKTWSKMSPRGREAAGTLALGEGERRLIEAALDTFAAANGS